MNMPTCFALFAGDAMVPDLIVQESAALIVLALTLVV